jgi:hypothetical protein
MQIWQCQAAEISSKKLLRAREKKGLPEELWPNFTKIAIKEPKKIL